MIDFVIKKLPYDLSSQAGLALVGKYLQSININALVDPKFPVRSGVANSDLLKCYIAMLTLGKNDFEAVEAFRGDKFASKALGLGGAPSCSTLRQRFDANASDWFELINDINQQLLKLRIDGKPIDFGVLDCGYTPIDLDTFVMNNDDSKKELVGRTYAGVDGYCPFAIYLGTLGCCLELALRPGEQHSVKETTYNLERALPLAAELTDTPLLVRADSGFCAQSLMQFIWQQSQILGRVIAFIIKWNPRTTPVETLAYAKRADPNTQWKPLRPGKSECVWQEDIELPGVGGPGHQPRRVYRLTERTIDKHGTPLLIPEYILEGWTTTLPKADFDEAAIIALYADHATHEQFHSEFKTDMDLERLPSGKFDTNYLVCQLGAVAMNLLRLIGQHTLHGPDSPVRHPAQRRRIKTVMKEVMFKAARLIRHAGRWILGLGANDPGFAVFDRHYAQMRSG